MEYENGADLDQNVEHGVEQQNSSKTPSSFSQVHGTDGRDQLGQDQRHGEGGEGAHEQVAREGEPHQVFASPQVAASLEMAEEKTESEPKEKAGKSRNCGSLLLQELESWQQVHSSVQN